MATLEKIHDRLETYKNHLPPAALERLQRALAEGVGGEKCGSFLAEIEEIHREFEAAIVSASSTPTILYSLMSASFSPPAEARV